MYSVCISYHAYVDQTDLWCVNFQGGCGSKSNKLPKIQGIWPGPLINSHPVRKATWSNLNCIRLKRNDLVICFQFYRLLYAQGLFLCILAICLGCGTNIISHLFSFAVSCSSWVVLYHVYPKTKTKTKNKIKLKSGVFPDSLQYKHN